MPKAEKGSIKDLANKMKAKGLQRLRWYCQVCEKQMRDENGFRQHTSSEGHVRQMLVVGENPHKHISDFSRQFQHDFVQLLRSSHGTKRVQFNHFYQEYIADKQHLHMNATRWASLTEFIKHLGRCGIVKVDETDKGYFIAWIDNSPDALARQEAIRKRERLEKGDEEREQYIIRRQIARANQTRQEGQETDEVTSVPRELQRSESEKISLALKPASLPVSNGDKEKSAETTSLSLFAKYEPRKQNVFAAAKGNSKAAKAPPASSRPMSTAERIMKEELERKKWKEERQKRRSFGQHSQSFRTSPPSTFIGS